MEIIPKIQLNKRLYMLMKDKDLPLHGRVFAWAIALSTAGIGMGFFLLLLSWAGVVQ